nr:mersacidin/lichenicidin family type 2 lantibiotic [Ktedonobacter robiniae]
MKPRKEHTQMQYDKTRAWKDEEYRESLEEAIESPVAELSEAELEQITGTGGYGGGAGGIGVGGGVEKYGTSAFGVVGNSYFCGNFSYRPRTNVNLGNRRNEDQDNDVKASFADVDLVNNNRRNNRNNRFDFGCSISGGIGGGTCIFGGN